MALDRDALEALGREQLISEARRFGVRRPEVMTRVELIDEVLRLGTPNPVERKKVRGWLGVARDLVADIVEQGLNLPDAAAMIRGDFRFEPLKPVQPPVATVTLAEIYGAQGHFQKALAILDEVLGKEPDHEAARKLRDRLERERASVSRPPAAVAASAPEVLPEEPEPEPPTPRQPLEALPAFATAHVPTPDDEPLTPRRLSKQPPADAPTIADYDAEPLTPRRLSKLPPAEQNEAASPDGTKRAERARDEQSESAQGVRGISPGEDYGGGGRAGMYEERPRTSDGRAGMLEGRALTYEERAVTSDGRAGTYEPEALLFRTSPTRAVVYFEIPGDHANGDAPIVHVVEWRPGDAGVERVTHELAAGGSHGTVVVEGLSPEAVVRGALGHRRHGRFKPYAVCAEMTMQAGTPTVVWSPRARKDYGPVAERAASHVSA
jgi:hypothetical protein